MSKYIELKEENFESVVNLLNKLDYTSKLNYDILMEKIKDSICDHLFIKNCRVVRRFIKTHKITDTFFHTIS